MISAIDSQPDMSTYKLFLPNPSALNSFWEIRRKPANLTIDTRDPSELREEYAKSDFGFILRDESIINKVACPTKLIEYLARGVIPIIKCPNIGDFENGGMTYVTIDNFRAGKIPSADNQRKMREKNY